MKKTMTALALSATALFSLPAHAEMLELEKDVLTFGFIKLT